MGSDGDILVSHGPPVFNHSPATYYNSYGNCRFQNTSSSNTNSTSSSTSTPTQRQRLKLPSRSSGSRSNGCSERKPRPCLVVRPDDSSSSSSSSSDENEPPSPNANRQKKKVVFADDRGFSLTQIRLMVETPLDKLVPIKAFANLKLASTCTEIAAKPSPINVWKVLFNQPASNYLEFRKRLEETNVSLENVIVKSAENDLTGTVKVKNISFEKRVVIRSTTDNWASHRDIECSFVDNNTSSSVTIIYDTFSFKIHLNDDNDNIQFCVCFKSSEGEYWDNNEGKNYTLVRKDEQNAANENKTIQNVRDIINNGGNQYVPVRSNTWPSYSAQFNNTNISSYQGAVYW